MHILALVLLALALIYGAFVTGIIPMPPSAPPQAHAFAVTLFFVTLVAALICAAIWMRARVRVRIES